MKKYKVGAVVAAMIWCVALALPAQADDVSRDESNVAVVYFDPQWGPYDIDYGLGYGSSNVRQSVAKEFYKVPTHLDQFDFIVVLTNFSYQIKNNGMVQDTFYTPVINRDNGIGKGRFDLSQSFGSKGRLQGYIDLGHVSQPYYLTEDRLKMLAQAFGHRWLAYPRYIDPSGNMSSDLLGENDEHWSFLLDSDGSFMGGNDWQDNGDGTFTSVGFNKRYSNLDLYLMGLLSPQEVGAISILYNPSIDKNALSQGGTISATAIPVTVDQIVAGNGLRMPAAGSAQSHFRMAFVLLCAPGTLPAQSDLDIIEDLRTSWEPYFSSMTRGRGSVTTDLNEATIKYDIVDAYNRAISSLC